MNIVDVSYGGENGFNQAIELSGDILANVKFIQEKKLIAKCALLHPPVGRALTRPFSGTLTRLARIRVSTASELTTRSNAWTWALLKRSLCGRT